MNNKYAIINGALTPESSASVLVADLSIQRGYGIFDFLSVQNFKPVFLEDHLNRFYFSAHAMHLQVNYTQQELTNWILDLIKVNQMPYSGVRITLTGGYSEDGYSITTPNLIITQSALNQPVSNINEGIKLVTYEHLRQLPEVKTINYLQAIYLQPFIKQQQANDILYHYNGLVCECPRANFFIVTHENEIITPLKNILNGITRSKILSFNQFKSYEADITLNEMYEAKEAFITSTTKNIIPVLQIDGRMIGDGRAGKISQQLYTTLLNLKKE